MLRRVLSRGLPRSSAALRFFARPLSCSARFAAPRISSVSTLQCVQKRWSSTQATIPPLTNLSEEEQQLVQTVAAFAKETIAPKVREMDEKSKLDKDVLKGLFENGLMGIEIPTEYGGLGLTFFQACLVIEELAKVDPAISVIVDVQNTLVNTAIAKFGTEEHKKKYFPRLAKDMAASFCLSEAGSGSDAFALKTTAKLSADGKEWVINGTKMWITNSGEAGLFVVFANTKPESGYKGIKAFLVEKGTPGLKVGKKEDKLGIRASSTCEVIFDDVRIPAENMLNGAGHKIAIGLLNEGRIGIGAQMLGLAEGAFDSAMPYIHERKQFGTVLADFQGMQHQFAQARVDIEAAKLLVYNAARLRDAGQDCVMSAAMAKLYASQVAERVASKSIEWLGGVGFTKDFPLEKYYRDAKIGAIYEGTTNLQLQTIAKIISKEYKR